MPEEQERKKGNPKKKKKSHVSWVVKIIFWTFAISMVMSIVSDRVLSAVDIFVAFFILLVFIAIGILFDIIGMSVATASEIPFHSMAAKKVTAASQALVLVRNAEKVSNFCNDVVGDICGIPNHLCRFLRGGPKDTRCLHSVQTHYAVQ